MVIGSHPVYVALLVSPLGFTVPETIDVGGWAVVVLLCQLATLALAVALGARRSEIQFTDDGVIDRRIIGSRHWAWSDLGCVAIGRGGRGSVHLVVCCLHDPNPHRLRGFPMRIEFQRPASSEVVGRLSSYGYPIERPDEDAHEWWALDPRSRRGA